MLRRIYTFAILLGICLFDASAAKSWSFQDASVSINAKGAGAGGSDSNEKFTPSSPVGSKLKLGSRETLTVQLTTIDGKEAKRAHQAVLTLTESTNGLEESFPLSLKENGNGKVEITQKDLPFQLLTSDTPLKASIVIGSFGSSAPLDKFVFNIAVDRDESVPLQLPEKPIRYGKQPEIHHIFRADPKSPPKVITLIFMGGAVALLLVLLGLWDGLQGNLRSLPVALSNAPIAHALFFGSIVALEGVFVLYYSVWNLFQMLPAVAVLGVVAFVSGSRALTEVQQRRISEKR